MDRGVICGREDYGDFPDRITYADRRNSMTSLRRFYWRLRRRLAGQTFEIEAWEGIPRSFCAAEESVEDVRRGSNSPHVRLESHLPESAADDKPVPLPGCRWPDSDDIRRRRTGELQHDLGDLAGQATPEEAGWVLYEFLLSDQPYLGVTTAPAPCCASALYGIPGRRTLRVMARGGQQFGPPAEYPGRNRWVARNVKVGQHAASFPVQRAAHPHRGHAAGFLRLHD